jgi:hypothetical protein
VTFLSHKYHSKLWPITFELSFQTNKHVIKKIIKKRETAFIKVGIRIQIKCVSSKKKKKKKQNKEEK